MFSYIRHTHTHIKKARVHFTQIQITHLKRNEIHSTSIQISNPIKFKSIAQKEKNQNQKSKLF